MEKILLVLDAHKPATRTIDFACRVAKLAQSKLTGLLVENVFFERVPAEPEGALDFTAGRKGDTKADEVRTDADQAVRIFIDETNRREVLSEVRVEKGEPIQEVIFETRFADLLILDPVLHFYDREEEQLPSHFVKAVLANAECPVLLAPEVFDRAEEIVCCYDGSASSVFAIKQYTYLFPGMKRVKVVLWEIGPTMHRDYAKGRKRMMEWLEAHYHAVEAHMSEGDVKESLFQYFFMKRNKMVVMGAYGRSMLSNFFRKSQADILVRTVDLPIFISHH